jgi:CBS domain containing-hemolysin-like protein
MNWDAAILIVLKILAVLALVLLNGFFVAAEFALVKIRDTQLTLLIRQGQRRAKVAGLILRRLDTFLSAAQLGITMASLGLGWIGEPVFTALLQPVFGWLNVESMKVQHILAFAIGFSAITFLHISAGEQAPKWLAIQKPLPTTLWVAYPMLWFYRLSYPLVLVLNGASQWLLRQVGLETAIGTERVYSENELRLLLDAAQKNRSDALLGRNIMLNALDLRHRVAREVMRPRHEIIAFDTDASLAECLALAEKTRYSRFPLCEGGDLDKTRGVVHIKDLYPALRDPALAGRTAADLLPVVRPLIYVPETARLEKLLQLFLERKLHFAIVVDEYGGTIGITTLENVLEELVGQIQDEFDQEKSELTLVSENVWEVAGTLPLHELEKIIGETQHEETVTTASGWMTQKLGGFPKAGDALTIGACELRVEEMDGPRVARLKITKHTVPESPEI